MQRIMITTSSRVAANMTAQGFNVRLRDFRTGCFVPFHVLDATMDTTGIFSIDEINQTIVTRKQKRVIDSDHDLVKSYSQDTIIADNHQVYDSVMVYDGDCFYSLNNWKFQCDKRNLTWLNKCYEIYA